MTPDPQTAIVRLLSAIALLLLLLVGGLAFAGFYALQAAAKADAGIERHATPLLQDLKAMRHSILSMEREMKVLRADMGVVRKHMVRMATDLEEAQTAAKKTSDQLAARQKVLDERLVARSRETLGVLREVDHRRDAVSGPPARGVFAKLDQMIGLQQVLADSIMLMNEHLAETQAISAHEIRPLPIQKQPAR